MIGLTYLVWVSIPLSLFVLALLYRLLQFSFPLDQDDDSLQRPRRLFQLANFFFLATLVCVSIDEFALQNRNFFPLGSTIPGMLRLLIYPIVIIVGFLLFKAANLSRPPVGFDRLRVDVRGSNPLILLIGLAVFALVLIKGNEGMKFRVPEGRPDGGQRGRTVNEAPGVLATLNRNLVQFFAEVRMLLGIPTYSAGKQSSAPKALWPDFNQEGYLLYKDLVASIAKENSVDPFLVQAVVEISSGFNMSWEGPSGVGLLQISESIASEYGAKEILNPRQNLTAGTRYLGRLLQDFQGDISSAVAAYRVGPEEVQKAGGIPADPETRKFVDRVITVYQILKAG